MDVPMRESRDKTLKSPTHSMSGSRLRERLTERVQRVRLASRVILVGLLISCAGLLWLSQTSTLVSLGYEMQTIDKNVVLLNRQAEMLQSQVAAFENLKRVEEEAKSKLGMVQATKFIYVKVPQVEAPPEQGLANPKLYPVNAWWRELTEMLPQPWQNSVPTQH